jgi:hypothetical protein
MSISGTVYDKHTSLPLSGLQLTALGSSSVRQTTTDANGKYLFYALPAETYTIEIAGYVSDMPIVIELVNRNIVNADFYVTEPGAISGRVTMADGITPLVGVDVIASGEEDRFGVATSAEDGTYSIQNLREGIYEVSISATGYVKGLQMDIEVVAGQATLDINFALESGGFISGKVTQADAVTPIENADVFASNADGEIIETAETSAGGRLSKYHVSFACWPDTLEDRLGCDVARFFSPAF